MNVGVKRFHVLHAGPTLPETCIYVSRSVSLPNAQRWGWQPGVCGSPCPHPDSTLKKAPVCPSIDTPGVRKQSAQDPVSWRPPLTLLDPDLWLWTPLPPIRRSYPLRFLTGAFNHVQGCAVRELPSWEAFCFPISNINVELFILLHLTFKCN